MEDIPLQYQWGKISTSFAALSVLGDDRRASHMGGKCLNCYTMESGSEKQETKLTGAGWSKSILRFGK